MTAYDAAIFLLVSIIAGAIVGTVLSIGICVFAVIHIARKGKP